MLDIRFPGLPELTDRDFHIQSVFGELLGDHFGLKIFKLEKYKIYNVFSHLPKGKGFQKNQARSEPTTHSCVFVLKYNEINEIISDGL